MRVLLFRSLCDSGGVSTSMLLLGRQLALRGITCEYWFCKPSNRLPEFMATGRATLGPLSGLAKRLDQGDFDVIHMTASDESAPLVARMARKARVVVTARGALAEGWNHTNCFAYTAISEGMAEVNQPYTDVEIEVIRNAIDVDRFTPPAAATNGAPIVAFVGRTTALEKDFPRFTRIASRLQHAGVRIWIADPHQASWEKFKDEPVEQFPVERWEAVRNEDIPDFYRAIAASNGALLVTSRTEGFGNVAPEAAACGARVLAPNVMGLREAILPNVTGRLFDADASDADAAAMMTAWLAEPHEMAVCSAAARSAFSPKVLCDAYEALYSRQEQKMITRVPISKPFREQKILVEQLGQQRGWRARAARNAALEFASEGFADLSISALMAAFRSAPGQFATRGGSVQLLRTLRGLAGRSALRRLSSQIGRE